MRWLGEPDIGCLASWAEYEDLLFLLPHWEEYPVTNSQSGKHNEKARPSGPGFKRKKREAQPSRPYGLEPYNNAIFQFT